MRVLHCIFTMGGGGAERQLAYLAGQMVSDDLEFHVVFAKDGPNLAILQQGGVFVHNLPNRAKYNPRILFDLYKLVIRLKPQIVQTWLTQMDILAGMVAWWCKVPVVLTERSSEIAYPSNIRHLLRSVVGNRAISIVANSKSGAEYWERQGFQREIAIIRNGFHFDQFLQVRPCSILPVGLGLTLSVNEKMILFAGRYNYEKNLEVLLKAFSIVHSQHKNVFTVLFGEGPMLLQMQTIHAVLPFRQRIHIFNYTNKLWEYMKRADVFVSLSLFEGNPNVISEAAALGCPLVLSDIYAHREIVDDDSAMFVPAKNAISAAGAIVRLLNDPTKAQEMAKKASKRIQEWSIQRTAQQYLDLYNRITKINCWVKKK